MQISERATVLWRSICRLEQCPRDGRGELSDEDAFALHLVWRELAVELQVSPLLEPWRAGVEPW